MKHLKARTWARLQVAMTNLDVRQAWCSWNAIRAEAQFLILADADKAARQKAKIDAAQFRGFTLDDETLKKILEAKESQQCPPWRPSEKLVKQILGPDWTILSPPIPSLAPKPVPPSAADLNPPQDCC